MFAFHAAWSQASLCAVCPLQPWVAWLLFCMATWWCCYAGACTTFISLVRRGCVLQGAERGEIHSALFRAGIGLLAYKHLIWASSFYCCCSCLLFQQSKQKNVQCNSLELVEDEVICLWSLGLNKAISVLWELRCFQVHSEGVGTFWFFFKQKAVIFLSTSCIHYVSSVLWLLQQIQQGHLRFIRVKPLTNT